MREEVFQLVRQMYKNEDGSPVELTPLQCCIFAIIAMKLHPRVHCMIFTRYGKSFVVALAVLTRVSTFPEKWAIVSGSKEKAKIIMGYINAHILILNTLLRSSAWSEETVLKLFVAIETRITSASTWGTISSAKFLFVQQRRQSVTEPQISSKTNPHSSTTTITLLCFVCWETIRTITSF